MEIVSTTAILPPVAYDSLNPDSETDYDPWEERLVRMLDNEQSLENLSNSEQLDNKALATYVVALVHSNKRIRRDNKLMKSKLQKVDTLEKVLIGEEKYGQEGLITKLERTAQRTEKFNYVMGGLILLGFIVTNWQSLQSMFGH